MSEHNGGSGGALDPESVPTEAQPVHQWLQSDGARWQARVPSHEPLDQRARMLSDLPPDPPDPGASAQPSWPTGRTSAPPATPTPPRPRGPLVTVLAATSAVVIVALFAVLLINLSSGRTSTSPAENTPTASASVTASATASPSPSPSATPSPSVSPTSTINTGPGSQLWLAWVGGGGADIYGSALVNNVIYTASTCGGSSGGHISALEAGTGRQLWTTSTGPCVQSGVAVLGNLAFVTLNNGDLQAYHLSDGSLAWSVSGASAPLKEPTVGAGLLFAVGYPGNAFQQTIYAFDPTTGHTLWTFPFNPPWEAGSFIEGTGQPVIDGGVLYMAEPSGSTGTSYLFAIRLSDHTQLWNAPIQGTGLAVANGIVYVGGASPYVGTNNANLEAFDAATGGVKWTQPATSAGSLNALTVANGMVYASANNGALFAFDAASGQSKWSYKTGRTILMAPAVANGVVYVGSHDDYLYAIDATTGQLHWKAVTVGEISDTPVVGNGVVYIGSLNAAFFAFRT